jgi:cell division protease FtsH
MAKNLILWVVIAIVLMSVFNSFGPPQISAKQVPYSDFIQEVRQGQVSEVMIEGHTIQGKRLGGDQFITYSPGDAGLVDELLNKGVVIKARPEQQQSLLMQMFISWFPMLLLIAVWIYFMRQMQGGGGGRGAMSFGRSRARMHGEDQVKVTFADVAGVEEAKEEVAELVEFLRDPSKFQKLGGKIPRGVLMVGSPGTGKTLLAKAIAGEAKVPFFSISGSDFVEMFVGVGAARVRDMFEQAKKHAPCIIFIDEIDAVGRHRGAGLGGGHDEREQTLNQLLVEMDGFEGSEGIIVIAATNRPVSDDVQPSIIARGTPGFSGADLANLVNEAALFAARANKRVVDMLDFEKAKDKIMMGAERRSMVMNEEEKKLTAYHEAGHAIVGLSVPSHDPVHKVSIIPRGRALGVTMFLPEEDRHSYSKQRLESQISSMMGGRLAEELIFGVDAVTTGASNDIQRTTEIARNMVTKWGLSERLGPLTYSDEEGEVFLGHSVTQHKMMADETAKAIDEEIRAVVNRNYERAKRILTEKMDRLHLMAQALIKYETIDSDQIGDIMAGHEPRPPKDWGPDSDSSSSGHGAPVSSSGKDGSDVDGGKIAGPPAEQH